MSDGNEIGGGMKSGGWHDDDVADDVQDDGNWSSYQEGFDGGEEMNDHSRLTMMDGEDEEDGENHFGFYDQQADADRDARASFDQQQQSSSSTSHQDEKEGDGGGGRVHGEPGSQQAPSSSVDGTSHFYVFLDDKAGMNSDALSKEHIAQVVHDNSVGSKFYKHQQRQDVKIQQKIQRIKSKLHSLTPPLAQSLEAQADVKLAEAEKHRSFDRVCCVIDLDAFYAAVEERQNPKLKDLPVAVGGEGMICTANYTARQFGVRSAMPGFIAKRLCKNLIFIPPHFDVYVEVAKETRAIFAEYDPHYRAGSLDEAYLDLTDAVTERAARAGVERPRERAEGRGIASWIDHEGGQEEEEDADDDDDAGGMSKEQQNQAATEEYWKLAEIIVDEMRSKIKDVCYVTASAGIATSFTLAKIASNINKPDGQYLVKDPFAFMRNLPVRKVPGIGRITEKCIIDGLRAQTCQELYNRRASLFHVFTPRTALWLLMHSIGLDGSGGGEEKSGTASDRSRKGMSKERTFEPVSLQSVLLDKLQQICDGLSRDLEEEELKAKTITVKIKTKNFDVTVRSKTVQGYISTSEELYTIASKLLIAEMPCKLRLLGVRASNFKSKPPKGQGTMDTFVRSAGGTASSSNSSAGGGKSMKFSSPSSHQQHTFSAPSNQKEKGIGRFFKGGGPASASAALSPSPAVPPAASVASYVCPVCNVTQVEVSLIEFNTHLDQCLAASQGGGAGSHASSSSSLVPSSKAQGGGGGGGRRKSGTEGGGGGSKKKKGGGEGQAGLSKFFNSSDNSATTRT